MNSQKRIYKTVIPLTFDGVWSIKKAKSQGEKPSKM